eukprot:COSAG01_NODE_67165_length_268_cov_0.366864_1_plen_45_part_10
MGVKHLAIDKTSQGEKLSAEEPFFKQTTAYGIMSGDWSSDVCSSD